MKDNKKVKYYSQIFMPSICLILIALSVFLGLFLGCKKSNSPSPNPGPGPTPPITHVVLDPSKSDWSNFYTITSGVFDNSHFKPGWQDWIKDTDYDTLDLGAFDSIDAEVFSSDYSNQLSDMPIQHLIFSSNACTSIGNSAFYGCSSITSIDLSNCTFLTSIGASAFNGCYSLVSVRLPDSLTSIGAGAFRNCSSLTSLILPNSLTSIGGAAFGNCSSLTSLALTQVSGVDTPIFQLIDGSNGNSVTDGSSRTNAFLIKSSDITNGTITATCGTDGGFAIGNIILSNIDDHPITSIGDWAFASSQIVSITFPNSLTSIGYRAFYACGWLVSITASYTDDPDWTIGEDIFNYISESGTVRNTVEGYTSAQFLDYLRSTGLLNYPGWTAVS